jgi:cell division septal protein FtsQ
VSILLPAAVCLLPAFFKGEQMPAKIGKRTTTNSRQQNPAKRFAGGSRSGGGKSRWQGYLPRALTLALCVAALVAVGVLYYAATASAFFQVRDIAVAGASRTSADDIRAIAQRHVSATGVWRADLEAISAEINRMPWVRQAIVSRVLPDGLRVTVKERVKTAVVIGNNGKAAWVDGEGVKLGNYSATDKVANLILLKGWDERETEDAQAGNRQRIETYKAMLAEWDAAGLSKRVSDVNLSDAGDVKLYLRSHPGIPIALGDRNWGTRLRDAIQTLDNEKRSDAQSLDAKLDDHVIVGYRENIAPPAASVTPNARPAVSPKPAPAR